MASSDQVPERLLANTKLRLNVGPDFDEPTMTYKVLGDDSCLRIQMAEGFDIKLLKNGKVLFTSQTDALTQMSELVATDLSPSQTYEVEVSKS